MAKPYLEPGMTVCHVQAGLDIKLVDAVARGASRFENLLAPLKTYWPPSQKLTAPSPGIFHYVINAS